MFASPVSAQPVPDAASAAGDTAFHDSGAATSSATDENDKARAIVSDILKSFGITAVNWSIGVTSNARTAQYAVAKFNAASGERKIIFNQEFLTRITEQPGRWAAYCVTAHEIGHHLRQHLQKPQFVTQREAELEADYDCGFVLGRMGFSYEQAADVLSLIPNTKEYPAREERRESIGKGWRDATGKAFAGQDELSDPNVKRRNSRVLSQFNLLQNRDIYGFDLASTGGVPGIPGHSLVACADRCRKDATCQAFSFDKWIGTCYVKGGAKSAVLDARSVVGVKKAIARPQPATGDYKFISARKRSFPDEPWAEVEAADFAGCRTQCGAAKSCVAYTFRRTGADPKKNCLLLSQANDGYFEDADADSGFKWQPPVDAASAGADSVTQAAGSERPAVAGRPPPASR